MFASAGYWAVGANEETAMNGTWKKGPGMELFAALEKAWPDSYNIQRQQQDTSLRTSYICCGGSLKALAALMVMLTLSAQAIASCAYRSVQCGVLPSGMHISGTSAIEGEPCHDTS